MKDNILSLVSLKLKKRRFQEQSVRKPIDMWTEMASVIAGRREEAITSAFSQVPRAEASMRPDVNSVISCSLSLVFFCVTDAEGDH